MSAGCYRKRPVTVEAVRFGGSTTHVMAVEAWMDGGDYVAPGMVTADVRSMSIDTLEGTMTARPGDYIIRGVQGEFYPCKPDVFAETYEPA